MGSSQRTAVAQPRSSQAQTSSPSLGCAGDSTTHVSCDILISEARSRPTTPGLAHHRRQSQGLPPSWVRTLAGTGS